MTQPSVRRMRLATESDSSSSPVVCLKQGTDFSRGEAQIVDPEFHELAQGSQAESPSAGSTREASSRWAFGGRRCTRPAQPRS